MPAPSSLYNNQNAFVRWDKLSPHVYRITNIHANARVHVTLTRLDGVKPEDALVHYDFELLAGESRTVSIAYDRKTEMGGDGVYRICALPTFRQVQTSTTLNSIVRQVDVITIPSASPLASISIDNATADGSLVVYNAFSAPPPPADFSNPPTSLQGLINGINSGIGGSVLYIAPNTVPAVPYLSPSPFPRLVVLSIGHNITELRYSDGDVIAEAAQINSDCIWQIDEDSGTPLPSEYWVSEFIVNNENILNRPYDLTIETGLFYAYLNSWLAANGGGYVDPDAPNFTAYSFNCQTFQQITYAAYQDVEGERECDNIVELSDTYACDFAMLREKLCGDPCRPCTTDKEKERERFFQDFNVLLTHGMVKLAAYDHLAYFGDFGNAERRLATTLDMAQYFRDMRRMLVKCGYDCATPSKCGCSSC